jgi:hypothetical protein
MRRAERARAAWPAAAAGRAVASLQSEGSRRPVPLARVAIAHQPMAGDTAGRKAR